LGDARQQRSPAIARVTAGDGLQIGQGLLAQAALVGLGTVLQQTVQRLVQVADLEGRHHAEFVALEGYTSRMRNACTMGGDGVPGKSRLSQANPFG
jgi:hypothetical protein